MFHIQLRQFPNVSREFNLPETELRARILTPWLAGRTVRSGEREWAPERARLTVYEGPALRPEEIGQGRGWANVTRSGEDVTDRMLASAPVLENLKRLLVERCASVCYELEDVVSLAGEVNPDTRPSERLALAEQAVWELLHAAAIQLGARDGASHVVLEPEQWRSRLLDWQSWARPGVFVEAAR